MGKMNDKQIRMREFEPHKWEEPIYNEQINNLTQSNHGKIKNTLCHQRAAN